MPIKGHEKVMGILLKLVADKKCVCDKTECYRILRSGYKVRFVSQVGQTLVFVHGYIFQLSVLSDK